MSRPTQFINGNYDWLIDWLIDWSQSKLRHLLILYWLNVSLCCCLAVRQKTPVNNGAKKSNDTITIERYLMINDTLTWSCVLDWPGQLSVKLMYSFVYACLRRPPPTVYCSSRTFEMKNDRSTKIVFLRNRPGSLHLKRLLKSIDNADFSDGTKSIV